MKLLKTWKEVETHERVTLYLSIFCWAFAIFYGILSFFDQSFLALVILFVGIGLFAEIRLTYLHFLYRFYLKEPIKGKVD